MKKRILAMILTIAMVFGMIPAFQVSASDPEVEFESEEAARRFVPPFAGREVTGEAAYSMAAYCRGKADAGQAREK